MKRNGTFVSLIFLACTSCLVLLPHRAKAVDVRAERAYQDGLAKERGRPLLYDLTAAWCGPCKRLVAEVFGNPDCAAMINKEFIPVQVVDRSREDGFNPTEVADLMETYQLKYFPTLVVTMPGG